jgi:hypothetical protein
MMSTAVQAPPTTIARDIQSPVLVAMADTFIGGMGHPGSPIRVAASMEETFRRLPSEADRRRLRLIVGVLGRRSGTFLLTGRPVPFHRWSRERRVAVMSAWSTSRLTFRRQLFQVFKRLSLLAFLGDTEDEPGLARDRLSRAGLRTSRDAQEHPHDDARRRHDAQLRRRRGRIRSWWRGGRRRVDRGRQGRDRARGGRLLQRG